MDSNCVLLHFYFCLVSWTQTSVWSQSSCCRTKLGGQQTSCRWSSLASLLYCLHPGPLQIVPGGKWATVGLRTNRCADTSKPCPWVLFKALFLDRNQAEEQRLWSLVALQGFNQPSSPKLAPRLLHLLLPCAKP